MDSLRLDLRYAVRSLLRRPAFGAMAILTLAMGIGLNAVAFSAVSALLFKPFRLKAPSGWLVDVSPAGPFTYGATAALQIVIALAACTLPAWRASKAEPVDALKLD